MPLKEYREKRDFNATSEPSGVVEKTKKQRFVVQLHRARAKHYDFRLEHKGVLVSFAVPKGLSENPKEKRLAVMVENHPVSYINFEGIIPKGNYGAGTVEIFDSGTYWPLENLDKGLKKGHIKVYLQGQKLVGVWALVRIKENNWLVIKENDKGLVVRKEKKPKLPFKTQKVQLATLVEQVPSGKNWIFEIKYDGYRSLAFVENKKAKLLSRSALDYTKKFSQIAESLGQIDAENFVMDGEIVVFDERGKSDFGKLQTVIKNGEKTPIFVVFDLLALNSEDLRELPIEDRKKRLEMLVFKANENIMFSSHVEDGKKAFKFAKTHSLEGIVAKKLGTKYSGERNNDWLKIKCVKRQEFVVGGYTTTEKNQVLSAVLVGYYDKNRLIFIGKIGVGFSEDDKKSLSKKFQAIMRKTCPFDTLPDVKDAVWVSPKLVAEVEYAEITKDARLRQPRFIGLRSDKDAKNVVLEEK